MVNENPTFLDRQYGVVVASARDALINPLDRSRYEIKAEVADGIYFRVSVKIAAPPQGVAFCFSPAPNSVTKFNIPALAVAKPSFRSLETGMQAGEGLDYLRDNLFALNDMREIGAAAAGLSLTALLDALIHRAIHTEGARLVAFGQIFKNDRKPDSLFHHAPSWAMHDVHMMQGDGALFVWFPPERQLAALFVRFPDQQLVTDQAGHPAAQLWQRQ